MWRYYDSKNTPLPLGMHVGTLATGPDGRVWVEVIQPVSSEIDNVQYFDAKTFGLMVYDQGNWKLFRPREIGLPDSLGTLDLACDEDGNLWIHLVPSPGTSVLYRFDGVTTKLYQGEESGLPLDVGALRGFASDSRHCFWAAMAFMGTYYFDGIRWHRFDNTGGFLKSGWVNSIASDNLGQMWFAVQSEKETAFVRYNGTQCILHTTAPIGYQQARVQALAIDSKGRLWVGWNDWGGRHRLGLWVWSNSTNEWTKYTSRNSALADDQITGIALDHLGRTWTATVGGLTILSGEASVSWGAIVPGIVHEPISQEKARPLMDDAIEKGEPLPFVFVGGRVASDSKGRIWTTSVSGLAVFLEN
jgi:ligand-binding sensor domain-containing protein